MNNFEYGHPRTEDEAVALLSAPRMSTAVLAGGTDLVGLMKRMVMAPDRVVNISDIDSLRYIRRDSLDNLWVGAAVHLDEFLAEPWCDSAPAVKQVIQGISSIQLQSQGTLVGELLRRPCCWYFRNGHDLLADRGRLAVEGDNRYHAILGNRGPAKFVSASRLAPALIALGAQVRVIGPSPDDEQLVDLESLYQTPGETGEQETTLSQGQLVTHIVIPPDGGRLSAAYEVRHGVGPDQPLAAAAVALDMRLDTVREARIVLGQVAPTPWIASDAARSLRGQRITEQTADIAGVEAVAGAMALSQNQYKIELTQIAVKRAILRAAGLDTGGF
jgi:xanthine dehydrogenase YagS FAD-binding subunit